MVSPGALADQEAGDGDGLPRQSWCFSKQILAADGKVLAGVLILMRAWGRQKACSVAWLSGANEGCPEEPSVGCFQ
ncbi:MAG: hypothetical protein WAW36_07145 [Methylovulum miyakonense]|uniref:hypothetical protein n=1 Tax=Methylovulum miyakonense TaxID=645578 RepID=UPI003BB5273D